jgi:outer membrane protein assembly factor BamB
VSKGTRALGTVIALVIGAGVPARLFAQARGGEWTTTAGDAQRTAWVRADARLTREAVQEGQFSFLWKMKLDNESRQWSSLTEPILLDRLIGYRGFKALGFVGGSADRVFAVDTDLGRPYFTTHVTYAAATGGQPPSSWECPGGLLATPSRRTTLAPSAFGEGGGGDGGGGAKSAVGEPGKGAAVLSEVRPPAVTATERPPARDDVAPPAPTRKTLAPIPFGGVDPLYVMGSDGLLRTLRVSDGAMTDPMVPFLPPSARPSSLTFIDGVIYTSTSHGCGAAPNGVWALDLMAENAVTTWRSGGAHVAGSAGPSFGTDGTIYVATTTDASTPPSPHANSVIALDPATLQPKDWLTTAGADFNASPVVFKHKDRELIAVSGNDGRLYLLDTGSLGGADHRTPLHVTAKYSAAGRGGGLATWADDEGTRWIAASVVGGPMAGAKFTPNGLAPAGSIVAFKLVDAGGRPALAPAWRSPNLVSPLAPLVVNGMVFAVSSGEYRAGPANADAPRRRQRAGPARLYVLDAASGKPLWNSGLTITSTARARIAAGSGQVYLVTDDNHLYAFGIPMEH